MIAFNHARNLQYIGEKFFLSKVSQNALEKYNEAISVKQLTKSLVQKTENARRLIKFSFATPNDLSFKTVLLIRVWVNSYFLTLR